MNYFQGVGKNDVITDLIQKYFFKKFNKSPDSNRFLRKNKTQRTPSTGPLSEARPQSVIFFSWRPEAIHLKSHPMIELKDWIIVHGTRTAGRPTVSRVLWGIVQGDPSHFHMPGDSCLTTRIKNISNGIAETEDDIYQLVGPGREIQIPNYLMPRLIHMTKSEWSKTIQDLTFSNT